MKKNITRLLKSFTLIELIIVIAIIAVLGTAAFLLLSQWMGKSRDASRIADLTTIDKSLKISMVNNETSLFPFPDSQTIIKIDKYGVLWYQGKFGDGLTNQVRSLTKVPKDPQGQLYEYSISNDRTKYQIVAFLEKEITSSSLVSSIYANNYNGKHIVTNYPGYFVAGSGADYLLVKAETILVDPSKIVGINDYSPNFSTDILNVNGGINNISDVLTGDVSLLFDDIDDNDSQAKYLIQGMFTGESISPILNSIINKPFLSEPIVDNTLSNSCSSSPACAGLGCILIPGIPTSVNQNWTKGADNCGFTCNDGYTGDNCEISGWKVLDPNCQLNDIVVGNQIWAGCNSTLGDGTIYDKNNYCYSYSATNIGGTTCYGYNTKEIDYNSTKGIDNIRGKQYTRSNASSACPSGRHLPSDEEWTILENTLNGTVCRSGDGRQCGDLGWKNTGARKLYLTLKIPLAGYLLTDGTTYQRRGSSTYLWSSTATTTEAYIRSLNVTYDSVYRASRSKSHGFSVRCIKD